MCTWETPTSKEVTIQDLRSALEHRAVWLYFLLDEARKRDCDWEGIARQAIYRTGELHGENIFRGSSKLPEFVEIFTREPIRRVFEMEIEESDRERAVIRFGYCPLVNAWRKLTSRADEIRLLCEIASEGDRGIASRVPDLNLEIAETIASGGEACRLIFRYSVRSSTL